jgi:hypothetical protein
MRKSIFSLAHEDDSELYGSSTGEITPEDMIENQSDHDEFNETAASAQTDIAAIEESDEIVEDASDVAEDIDDKLEEPEKVTGDDVMVAQESMRIICHRYGIAPEAVLGRRLSHESASVNPIHSLKLAREESDSFIKRVIDGIRNIFKRLIVTIKKLYAKAVVLLSRTEKVANKLNEKLADYGEAPADAKFDDKEIAKIGSGLGAVILVGGGKLGKNPSAELKNYITVLQDAKYINSFTNVLKDGGKLQVDLLKAAANKDKNAGAEAAAKAGMEFVNSLMKANGAAILDKATDSAKDSTKFNSADNAKGNTTVFALTGTKLRAFVADDDNHIFSATFTAKPDALKNISVDIPSKANIRELLKEVAATAKKSKEFEAAATKEVNEADKLLVEMSKELSKIEFASDDKDAKDKQEAKRATTKYLSAVRIVTANLAVDSILAQVSGTKSILTYCAIASKKLTKPDKK